MSKNKSLVPSIRSSAAEYLTFVAGSGTSDVNAIYADENIWLSQKMMGLLYDVNVRTINEHLQHIFADSELQESSVIRKFRITAAESCVIAKVYVGTKFIKYRITKKRLDESDFTRASNFIYIDGGTV